MFEPSSFITPANFRLEGSQTCRPRQGELLTHAARNQYYCLFVAAAFYVDTIANHTTQAVPEQLFSPIKLVERAAVLRGTVPLNSFERLLEAAGGRQADAVEYCLYFRRDEHGNAIVTGEVAAVLELECQRCLARFAHKVRAEVQVEFVKEADAQAKLPGFDAVYVKQPAPLGLFLETELLLALPFAPAHKQPMCRIDERYAEAKADDTAYTKASPFAVLREWVTPANGPEQ
ncbi:MAG: hypothetical protein GKR94_14800 [Gammaproteobacteria bacterium]|nr:hypothetical protein [Gammaproteobacteria bacterium]